MFFPDNINKIVEGLTFSKDLLGRSEDMVLNFENKYILKVSSDCHSLENEKEKNDWVSDQLKGPKTLAFEIENGKAYYLRECINGDNLISKRFLDDPKLLIELCIDVVNILRSISNDCPFMASHSEGTSFIHGDLCLPNIYVDKNNSFLGFIDLGESGLGDPFYDYAWLIWSIEYNLGSKEYTNELLSALGIEFDEDKYQRYVLDVLDE